jgi:hypothetical protein
VRDKMVDKKLKKYKKPIINVFGNVQDVTMGGEDDSGDKLGLYGESG